MKLGSKEADVAYDRWIQGQADEYWGADDSGDEDAESEAQENAAAQTTEDAQMKWQDWLILAVLFCGYGWAGSNDYDYRCKQAHDMNKQETCRMVAAK